jgi:hypothetical protein
MRWILTLVALAAGAWFFTNRRRRAQLQERVQDFTPPSVQDRVRNAASTVTDLAAGAREQAGAVASQVTESATQAAGAAKEAATKAQQSVQSAAATVMPAQETGQQDAEQAQGTGVETDVDTGAPSIKDTVQSELSDVGEKVDAIRSEATAPPDQAEKSAGESFGAGTTNATEMHTAMAPTSTREAATETAPAEGQEQGTHPIAGESTTTATGGTVDALSPTPQGAAAGTVEPLPAGLTPGEPGTGGPQGSSQAPSTPDSAAAPTTGKEQPP